VAVEDLQEIVSGRGVTDWFSVADPAAGANASFTTGSRRVRGVRVLAALATLATDANAANRLLALDYIDGRNVTRVRNAATLLVTANTSATVFQWDQAHAVSEWQTGTPVFAPLADVILTPGWTVQVTVDNKQAGDQLSAVSFVVENFYAD
jgi:hypothetical protein